MGRNSADECEDDCPACSGEACALCGAGTRTRHGEPLCDHDVVERHATTILAAVQIHHRRSR
jgi:hypothetical protein